jgi:hypothetical protein
MTILPHLTVSKFTYSHRSLFLCLLKSDLFLSWPVERLVLPPGPGLILAVAGVAVTVLDLLPRLARFLLQLGHVFVHFPVKWENYHFFSKTKQ